VRQRGGDSEVELTTASTTAAATTAAAASTAASATAAAAAAAEAALTARAAAAAQAEAAAFTAHGSVPPADIWVSTLASLGHRSPHRDSWDSLPRDARLDRWGRSPRSFRCFPPPWATPEYLSWLYMPLILCAAGHPGGQQLLDLRSPSCTAQPVARGGLGCIPHLVYSAVDETTEEEAAYLLRQVTVLDFGLLISTLREALDSLRLTARDIERAFDGTLHLPAVLQDVIIGTAAPLHDRFMGVLDETAAELVGWASRAERQRLARVADDAEPGTILL